MYKVGQRVKIIISIYEDDDSLECSEGEEGEIVFVYDLLDIGKNTPPRYRVRIDHDLSTEWFVTAYENEIAPI